MDKQIGIYTYDRMLLNHKKEWISGIRKNVNEYQKPLYWLKEFRQKRVYAVWLYSYKILETNIIYCGRNQISGYMGLGVGSGRNKGKGYKGIWRNFGKWWIYSLFLLWCWFPECQHMPKVGKVYTLDMCSLFCRLCFNKSV